MKRLFTLLALLFVTAGAAFAQFGVIGGYTRSGTGIDKDLFQAKNMSQYHADIAYRFDLPFLTIQPQLTYEAKGVTLNELTDGNVVSSVMNTSGFAEFGVGFQLGVDLLAFRPYFLVQPFVGYDVLSGLSGEKKELPALDEALASAKNKLEYGFGIGAGLELINHIQLSVQWFMNMGSLYDNGKLDQSAIKDAVLDSYKEVGNYQGIKVSLGLFF